MSSEVVLLHHPCPNFPFLESSHWVVHSWPVSSLLYLCPLGHFCWSGPAEATCSRWPLKTTNSLPCVAAFLGARGPLAQLSAWFFCGVSPTQSQLPSALWVYSWLYPPSQLDLPLSTACPPVNLEWMETLIWALHTLKGLILPSQSDVIWASCDPGCNLPQGFWGAQWTCAKAIWSPYLQPRAGVQWPFYLEHLQM